MVFCLDTPRGFVGLTLRNLQPCNGNIYLKWQREKTYEFEG